MPGHASRPRRHHPGFPWAAGKWNHIPNTATGRRTAFSRAAACFYGDKRKFNTISQSVKPRKYGMQPTANRYPGGSLDDPPKHEASP